MSLSDYIGRYVAPGGGGGAEEEERETARGYLAQHPLFDQIPALREDIATPAFCSATTAQDAAVRFKHGLRHYSRPWP